MEDQKEQRHKPEHATDAPDPHTPHCSDTSVDTLFHKSSNYQQMPSAAMALFLFIPFNRTYYSMNCATEVIDLTGCKQQHGTKEHVGRDAFHRVPAFKRKMRDVVESVPTVRR
jgi:hypothetical protein